jgi:hypothetical protein
MSRSAHTFLSKNKQVAGMAVGAIAMLAVAVPALAQESSGKDEVFSLTTIIGLDNTGLGNLPNGSKTFFSFDISWFNPGNGKFYLADRSNKTIDIFDPKTGTFTQAVNKGFQGFTGNNDGSGPDGVLDANDHQEIWVGDVGGTCFPLIQPGNKLPPTCGPGQVWVLNLDGSVKTGLPANPIPVGGKTRADEMCYDSKDHLIMLASPGEDPPFVTFIDTKAHKVLSQLKFDGKSGNTPNATNGLEQCGWSEKTGLFYQNVPEIGGNGDDTSAGGISVIDPKSVLSGSPKVERTVKIPLADCAGPQGMAIGRDQIMEGCNAASPASSDGIKHRNTVIVHLQSLEVAKVFKDLGGDDEVWFNPADGHFFVPSCNTTCRTQNAGVEGVEHLGVIDSSGRKLDQAVDVAVQTPPVNPATSGNPRTIHSVAASSNKMVFLPIPAVGGAAPQFGSTLCDSTAEAKVIGTTPVSSATGCIAILTTTKDDNPAAED